MNNNKTYWAFIPARGGSKRLPGKNIKTLAGKPLIAWTIEAALQAPAIDRVIVNTESEAIASTAKQWGAEVPFLRPEQLATDRTSTQAVIAHALNTLREQTGSLCDYIVLLQPTAPLRDHNAIEAAIQLLGKKKGKAVVSVCTTQHSPLWSNTLPENLAMDNFIRDEVKGKRAQDLPLYYRINGAIYIIETTTFLQTLTFLPEKQCYAFIMDPMASVDIDNEIDFIIAESIIKGGAV